MSNILFQEFKMSASFKLIELYAYQILVTKGKISSLIFLCHTYILIAR